MNITGDDPVSKKTYFQYQKELNLPVYLTLDLTNFEPGLGDFLAKQRFSKLTDKEEIESLKSIKTNPHARVLHIGEASPIVAKQIKSTMDSDRYGSESIIPKEGYRVYRYKDLALMVYSFGAKEWQLGCYRDFGSSSLTIPSRVILNRFLSWALVPHGIVGLWGVGIDDGMVAQRPADSKGEAVFIDIVGFRLLSIDGVKKLRSHFKILRLDPTLKGRNIKMSNEELVSLLFTHSSYLDSAGPSVPVRQMIQTLSRMSEGLIHPQESFRPRTDLSL